MAGPGSLSLRIFFNLDYSVTNSLVSGLYHNYSENFKPCQPDITLPLVSKPTVLLILESCTMLTLTYQSNPTLACLLVGRETNKGAKSDSWG